MAIFLPTCRRSQPLAATRYIYTANIQTIIIITNKIFK